MELLEKTALVLKEILTTKKNYFDLISQEEKKGQITTEEKGKMIQLVGSFLRNYHFIRQTARFVFYPSDIDTDIRTGIYYVNNAYVKAVAECEALDFLVNYFHSLKKVITDDQKIILNAICREKKKYEFDQLARGSFKYFSVKFNLPEWFIKMMNKHYGKDAGLRTCREISRMPNQYACLNTFKELTSEEKDLLAKDFTKVNEQFYLFNDKVSLRKHKLIKSKVLFPLELAFSNLFEVLPEEKHAQIAIYLGNKNNVYFPLAAKYAKDGNNLSIITKHLYENYDLLTKIKEYKIKNTHFYESEEDGLEPRLSKKQDLFIYFPSSSEIENFRIEPDYSIFFEQSSLDILIKEEKQGLENVSKYINDGGTLVYCVKTLGKKETSTLIEEFLAEHADFELIEEKQFFPFEEENSILYYAVLRKKA